MADKKEEVAVDVEKEVAEVPEAKKPVVEEKEKPENGAAAAENGDAVEDAEEAKEEEKNGDDSTDGKVCSIKRKSTGGAGDAPEETPAEGVTPEKKAKLDVSAEPKDEAEATA